VEPVEAIVYGIIQGATEYLPVSSTAHLALAPWLLGWDSPSFAFNTLVQVGTLLAVIMVLRKDLWTIATACLRALRTRVLDDDARLGLYLVLATIPAAIAGLFFKDAVEAALNNPRQVLYELFVTGLLLAIGETLARARGLAERGKAITLPIAMLIGCAQAVAIMPGISRSGATIAMVLGVSRKESGRFSFLLSVPALLGAGVLELKDLLEQPALVEREGGALVIAFVVAAITGLVCVTWFLGFLKRHSLYWFAAYCMIVASLGLAFGVLPS
jgi:undecaprenyl-diphosphatase